jgi:phytoene dehydrogenase-like protein
MTANDYLVGMHWHDVIVIGAGHNGLVAALLFAKKGLKVLVVEEKETIGGAVRTERPFAKVPDLAASTGATQLGLMPPELLAKLEIELPLVRHEPHTFLPTTTKGRSLALSTDAAQTKEQITRFSSEGDAKAYEAMNAELAQMRDDVARTWLEEPLSIEETAERYVRGGLRAAFVDLCRKPLAAYLDRWAFGSDALKGLIATCALSGAYGTWDTPGTGMSFFARHMTRLPDSHGSWMSVRGGMGTVARMIADGAIRHGAILETEAKVSSIVVENGVAKGVVLKDGTMHHATAVLCNADPFRMREMVGREKLPADYNSRLDGYRRDGMAMKVDLALSALPQLACAPDAFDRPGFAPTMHLFPDEGGVLRSFKEGFEGAKLGKLSDPARIEWQVHTLLDRSLQDADGHHHASLLAQWVPHEPLGTTWDAASDSYVKKLLAICDRFAPGTSALVVDTFVLSPPKIEQHFGITHGNMHHVDNGFGFADRLPYGTPVQGLYTCSAGTHPADAVVGAAGHNAALRLLRDMGKPLTAPPPRLSAPPPR